MICHLIGTKPLRNQCWISVNWTLENKFQWYTGDPLHSRAACTQPCNVNTHSRAHCSPGARLCEQWEHGCVNNGAQLCASARLCRGSPVWYLKFLYFYSRKCVLKHCLESSGHFVSVSMCQLTWILTPIPLVIQGPRNPQLVPSLSVMDKRYPPRDVYHFNHFHYVARHNHFHWFCQTHRMQCLIAL